MSDQPAGPEIDDDDDDVDDGELASDPVTGSTPTDPSVDDVGLPPGGDDPMAGEAPSS